MLGPEVGATQCDRPVQVLFGLVVTFQLDIGPPEGIADRRFHQGLLGEPALDCRIGPPRTASTVVLGPWF